jgi:hypothetical protein
MVVVKLKLACGKILGFKVDLTQNELNPARDENKKYFIFSRIYFQA